MDDRKLKILSAVVNEYIVTGEPVGSKAIMAHVKASSATIRNEMAELEKQGYLEQPHTSAGRIPTYKGYRLYVDQLMEQNQLTANEKKMLDSMIPQEYVTEEDLQWHWRILRNVRRWSQTQRQSSRLSQR